MTPAGETVCLCMIVKDEAHVIRRCLASVRPILDHWIVVDTGSSDGTQALVREAMAGLPGEVVDRPWVDFAHNRSEALALARPHATYSLIIDADDELLLAPGFALPPLGDDSYAIDIHYGGTTYSRPQLVKNALAWRYRGVLHEFLECAEAKTQGHLPIVMKINHEGARSTDTTTYAKDAAILERALLTETDPFLRARYTFYLAQSYRDCGEREKALTAYLSRAALGFWDQEVYVSLLNAGRLMEALGRPLDYVLATYRRATEVFPARAEAAHAASRLCRLHSRFADGYAHARPAVGLAAPDGGLFVEPWIYDYGLADEFAVNAYWSAHYRDCLDSCLGAMQRGKIPPHELPRFLANMRFAFDKLSDPAPIRVAPPASSPVAAPAHLATSQAASTAQVYSKQFRVFRQIHIIWVGDETKRPDNCIDTWRRLNPDWKVIVWGNTELESEPWRNDAHIRQMLPRELNGVADMMRWEILHRYGGFAVDADSICVRPLEDWLFEPEIFACWENEVARPGLVAAGYVYSHPGNVLINNVIEDIAALPDLLGKRAWETVGPQRLTDTIRTCAYNDITLYPSHYFLPRHLSGMEYKGGGPIFAKQLWGSTFPEIYETLASMDVSQY